MRPAFFGVTAADWTLDGQPLVSVSEQRGKQICTLCSEDKPVTAAEPLRKS